MPNSVIKKTEFYLIDRIPHKELALDFHKVIVKATKEYPEQSLCMIILPILPELFYYNAQEFTNLESHYSIYDTKIQGNPVTNNHITYIGILTSDMDKPIGQSCSFIKIHIFTCPESSESLSLVSFYSAKRKKNKQYGPPENVTKPTPISPMFIRPIREQLMRSVILIESALQKQAKIYQTQAEKIAVKIDRNTQYIISATNNVRNKFVSDIQKELNQIKDLLPETEFDFIQAKIVQLNFDIAEYKKELSRVPMVPGAASLDEQVKDSSKKKTALISIPIDEEQWMKLRWRKMEKLQAESEGLVKIMNSDDTLLFKFIALKNFEKNYQSISVLFTFFDAWNQYLDYTLMQSQFMKDIICQAARAGNIAVLEQCEHYIFDAETVNHMLIIATAHNQINVLMFCFSRFQKQSFEVMVYRLEFQNTILEKYQADLDLKKGDISLFHAAIIFNKPEVTRYLIQKGFPLNILVTFDEFLLSYLDLAIMNGCEEIARILLDEQISITKEYGFVVNNSNQRQDINQLELISRARLVNSYCTALREGSVNMLRMLQEYPQDPWYDPLDIKGIRGNELSMPSLLFFMISHYVPKDAIFKSEELLTETTALFRKMPDSDKSNRNAMLNTFVGMKKYRLVDFFLELGAVHNAEPIPLEGQMFPMYSTCDILFKKVYEATEAFSEEESEKLISLFERLCTGPSALEAESSYIIALINICAIIYEAKIPSTTLTSALFKILYRRVDQFFSSNPEKDYFQSLPFTRQIMIGFIKIYWQLTSGYVQRLESLEAINQFFNAVKSCCLDSRLTTEMRHFFCATMFKLIYEYLVKLPLDSPMRLSFSDSINNLLQVLYQALHFNFNGPGLIAERNSVGEKIRGIDFVLLEREGTTFQKAIELTPELVLAKKEIDSRQPDLRAMLLRGIFAQPVEVGVEKTQTQKHSERKTIGARK